MNPSPLGTRDEPIPNPPITMEGYPDGTVLFTIRLGDMIDPDAPVAVFALGAPEAIKFAGSVANVVAGAALDALRETAAGPCDVCHNARLVHVEQHGHMVAVDCPGCRNTPDGPGPWVTWRDGYTAAVPAMVTAKAARGDQPWTREGER